MASCCKCGRVLKECECPESTIVSESPSATGLEGPLGERKEWIDIEKEKPELFETYDHSETILVTDGRNIWVDTYWKSGGWSHWADWEGDPITHWMKLPELPKAD